MIYPRSVDAVNDDNRVYRYGLTVTIWPDVCFLGYTYNEPIAAGALAVRSHWVQSASMLLGDDAICLVCARTRNAGFADMSEEELDAVQHLACYEEWLR